MFCGIVPATFAIIIVLAYWITYQEWLVDAGKRLLVYGGITVVIGLGTGTAYLDFASKATVDKHAAMRKGRIATTILGCNFPLAFICILVGGMLGDRPSVTLTIVNHSNFAVQSGYMAQGGWKTQFGSIPVNGRIDFELRLHGEMPVTSQIVDSRGQHTYEVLTPDTVRTIADEGPDIGYETELSNDSHRGK